MGRKRIPGLYKRGEFWHIDKTVHGTRLCESTGASSLEEAEKYLARRIEQMRQAFVFGVREPKSFVAAATKYLLENQHKASIVDDAMHLKQLQKYIGQLNLDQIHNGTLRAFIEARQKEGLKNKSINLALGVVRRILNLATSEWLDNNGLTWILSAPKIKMLTLIDAREPYPLSINEQEHLFSFLPEHLQDMTIFKVNTGCREQEVCRLQWDWEFDVPELDTSVFIIPKYFVKNRTDRLVVLNKTAKAIVEKVRGNHPLYVFTYNGCMIKGMNNTAWRRARQLAGLPQVRVHDLKHTFGRRLRAMGVSFEDRQDLLGHRSGKITTHYSAAEIGSLLNAANKVCEVSTKHKGITLLRTVENRVKPSGKSDDCVDILPRSRKSPAKSLARLKVVG